MIPWEKFETPLDAYEWAKANLTERNIYGKMKLTILAPAWSDNWYLLDEKWKTYAIIRRKRDGTFATLGTGPTE